MPLEFEELTFSGRAWPAARVAGSVKVVFKDQAGQVTGSTQAIEITTRGVGREFFESRPAGYWRNFGALDASDPVAVEAFVQRRGDPFGKLAPATSTDTSLWPPLIELLQWLANRYWGPRGEDGVSRCDTGLDSDIETDLWMICAKPVFQDGLDIRPVPTNDGSGRLWLSTSANSLAAFLLASAASQLSTRASLRVCTRCDDWFAPRRTDALYCSPACRSAASIDRQIDDFVAGKFDPPKRIVSKRQEEED